MKTADMTEDGINVFYDSSKVINSINKELMNNSQKATKGVEDRVASIYEIIKIIK